MRASDFDLVSSGLTASMVLVGVAVLVLFSLWVTGTEIVPDDESRFPNTRLVSASSSAIELEFEMPSDEETVALKETTLQQMVQNIESVQLIEIAGGHDKTPKAGVIGAGVIGAGVIEVRPAGLDSSDSSGTEMVPRFERWHLLFSAPNPASFARQLDSLKIELGAFGGGVDGIDYAREFSTRIHRKHNSKPETETRLYFSWSAPSPLARFERDLLVKAGVRVAGRQIVKFVPKGLEQQLAQLELNYAHTRGVFNVGEIAKTVFQCRRDGQNYGFFVVDQRYVGVP